MDLSKRLQAVADLLYYELPDGTERYDVVADVGTDHGYIPIYLVEAEMCDRALAMDVNKGPLLRAKEHIAEHGLKGRIETRLSDGVSSLAVGECDAAIVAGMGGALTIKIMTEGEEIFRGLKTFVLQPQSEIAKVRAYLCDNDYCIVAEDMVLEDGKFYPMMRVQNGRDDGYSTDAEKRGTEFSYGKCLLAQRHRVLKLFLEKEMRTRTEIFALLPELTGDGSAAESRIELRKKNLEAELCCIRQALRCYDCV